MHALETGQGTLRATTELRYGPNVLFWSSMKFEAPSVSLKSTKGR
ncbi:MAG TPA: hypothetical protein VMI72_12235 [Roseiarcus sp.]|nr:hypothetical protein [Roseiarcus sp.]